MEENLDALLSDYIKNAKKQLYSDKVETIEIPVQNSLTHFSLKPRPKLITSDENEKQNIETVLTKV